MMLTEPLQKTHFNIFISFNQTVGVVTCSSGLTELVLALQLAAVEAARPGASAPGGGRPGPPRIFALRDPWEKTIGGVAAELGLPAAHVQLLTFVDTVEEFVACLDRDDPLATASRL